MRRTKGWGVVWVAMAILCFPAGACAEWMWTPESGKWISDKNIEKKSAMLLYEEAQSWRQAGEIRKALSAYRKLIKQYPASTIAPDAQYEIGQLLEGQGDYYKAFKEYQKVIENYPSYKKFDEILDREYQIGNLFLSGEKMKFLGIAMLPAVDKAIEVFESIVRTAPYSSIAPRAQFNVGEAYRKIRRYNEAIPEYQKVIDNYSDSDLVPEARYQMGQCSYQTALKDAYDQTNTDVALSTLKNFVKKHQDNKKAEEIQQRINELTDRKAKKSFDIAEFYLRSKADEAAIIYYLEVIEEYPQSAYAKAAEAKIKVLEAKPKKTEEEIAREEEQKNILAKIARLLPFQKKEEKKAEAKPAERPAPAGKKPFWAFWVKEPAEPVKEVAAAKAPEKVKAAASAPVKAVSAGQKPFWAFWVKEPAGPIKTAQELSPLVSPAEAQTPAQIHIREMDESKSVVSAPAMPAPGGKKPFWAFWVKEPAVEKIGSLAKLSQDAKTPSRAAGQMKLPDEAAPSAPPTQEASVPEGKLVGPAGLMGAGAVAAMPVVAGAQATAVVAEAATTIPPVDTAAGLTAQPAAPELLPAPDAVGAVVTPVPVPDVKPPAPVVLQIKSFKWEQDGSKIRLLFETNGDLQYRMFYLKDPARILVSFSKGVFSQLQDVISVNKYGVLTIRQHLRSKESESPSGKPLNAIVIDLQKNREASVCNDVDTFVIELEKG